MRKHEKRVRLIPIAQCKDDAFRTSQVLKERQDAEMIPTRSSILWTSFGSESKIPQKIDSFYDSFQNVDVRMDEIGPYVERIGCQFPRLVEGPFNKGS